jgi:hypothetical protein
MNTIPNEIFVNEIGKFLTESDIQILRNVNSRFYNLFPSHKLKMSYLVKWYLAPSIKQWLGDNGLEFDNLMYNAALGGHLEIIQWLRAQNPPCPWNELVCAYAVKGGHLEIIQWLRAQTPACPWDKDTSAYASASGNLEVLRWLRSQNPPCPWDKKRIWKYAEQNGDVEILEWLKNQDLPLN